jgi:hypothetical protein
MAPLRSNVARLPLLGPALFDVVRALRHPEAERTVRGDLAETRAARRGCATPSRPRR